MQSNELRQLTKRSWAEVDLDALGHNYQAIRGLLKPECKLVAVVKANAYGHGEAQIALEMDRLGADWFAVAAVEEGTALRSAGIKKPILLFAPADYCCIENLAEQDITLTIPSLEYGQRLNELAAEKGINLQAHLKLDSGMGRWGLTLAEESFDRSMEQAKALYNLSNIEITGIYTHFATADSNQPEHIHYKERQFGRFTKALQRLEAEGVQLGLRHCCNSAATLCDSDYHLDMVRPGIAMYGNLPGPRCKGAVELRQVMTIYSRVTVVKEVLAGESVGYGARFTAARPTKVVTIGYGYADGYQRSLGGKGYMLINGSRAENIGTVCMDALMLDATGIDVAVGDKVTAVGVSGTQAVTWTALAERCGTISYELTCAVGRRLPRIYKRQGAIIEQAEVDKSM